MCERHPSVPLYFLHVHNPDPQLTGEEAVLKPCLCTLAERNQSDEASDQPGWLAREQLMPLRAKDEVGQLMVD